MNNNRATIFEQVLAAADEEFANFMLKTSDGPCLVPNARTEAARSEVFRHIKSLIVCAYLECSMVRKTHDAIVVFDNILIEHNPCSDSFRITESHPKAGKLFETWV